MLDFGFGMEYRPLLPKIKTFDFTNQYIEIAKNKKNESVNNLSVKANKKLQEEYRLVAPSSFNTDQKKSSSSQTIESEENEGVETGGLRDEQV